ncbi:MAG TPA: hypothetical protein VLH56_12015 [Dissulfurispiraceae bacterium]|nr:hypothetical protein [Dissulfurispiraceae bacterium]
MRRMLRFLLRTVDKVLFRDTIKGRAGQFGAERLLVVTNHESFLDDPPLPGADNVDHFTLTTCAETT